MPTWAILLLAWGSAVVVLLALFSHITRKNKEMDDQIARWSEGLRMKHHNLTIGDFRDKKENEGLNQQR